MKFEIIRDPLWNNIRVDAFTMRLVDTPAFQRLRYVRQLGLAYLVYPGATHTRFEHALGAYHLARRALALLEERREFERLAADECDITRVAAEYPDLGEEVVGALRGRLRWRQPHEPTLDELRAGDLVFFRTVPRTREIRLRSGGILPNHALPCSFVMATWICSPNLAPVKIRFSITCSSVRPRTSAMREYLRYLSEWQPEQ